MSFYVFEELGCPQDVLKAFSIMNERAKQHPEQSPDALSYAYLN